MPQPRKWTESADVTICNMRRGGATWAEIGCALSLSRNTVIERGRRLHAAAPVRAKVVIMEKVASDDPNRSPLPAGHWLTWGLLTDAAYPGLNGHE
jgi:hypothetical protein